MLAFVILQTAISELSACACPSYGSIASASWTKSIVCSQRELEHAVLVCLYLLCSLGVDAACLLLIEFAVVWQCWFCIGSCCPSQVCDTCISPSLFVAEVVLQVPVHSLHHSHLGSVSPCVLPSCKNLDWLRVVWSRWTTGY